MRGISFLILPRFSGPFRFNASPGNRNIPGKNGTFTCFESEPKRAAGPGGPDPCDPPGEGRRNDRPIFPVFDPDPEPKGDAENKEDAEGKYEDERGNEKYRGIHRTS
jgi:hypothetical protein